MKIINSRMIAGIILAVFAIFLVFLVVEESWERNKGINKQSEQSSIPVYPTTTKTKQEEKKVKEIDMSKKHRGSKKSAQVCPAVIKKETVQVQEVKELTSKDAYKILIGASEKTSKGTRFYEISYTLIDRVLDDLFDYAAKQKKSKSDTKG